MFFYFLIACTGRSGTNTNNGSNRARTTPSPRRVTPTRPPIRFYGYINKPKPSTAKCVENAGGECLSMDAVDTTIKYLKGRYDCEKPYFFCYLPR